MGNLPISPPHLTFSVANPIIARVQLMIQNRITICGSAQPFFSKWWWIGAIRKIGVSVRLQQKTGMIAESA